MNFIYFIPLFVITVLNNSVNANGALQNQNYQKEDTIKTMRIEYYLEVDKGRANAGSDKIINLDGTVHYMGRADYQPYVKRCVYDLNEEETTKLLDSKLLFLPYFREIKTETTLRQYFESIQAEEKPIDLFPKTLDGYYQYPDDDRAYFDCLLSNDLIPVRGLLVIYLNEEVYYLDKTYYRLEWEMPAELFTSNCEDTYRVGELSNFVRTAPLVQSKIEEGKADTVFNYSDKDLVASILTSPCRGNCEVYRLEVYGNGKIIYNGYSGVKALGKHETKTSQAKIKLLLKKALSINYAGYYKTYTLTPRQFVHDEQPITTEIWSVDGVAQKLISPTRTPQELVDFYSFFVQLFEVEIGALK